MDDDDAIRAQLRHFVVSNFLFGDVSKTPTDQASLMELGLIDSTGILELIEFLEEQFHVDVTEAETLPQNLGSIEALVTYVTSKRQRA